MRKILFIDCCGECFYHIYSLKLNGYTCSHSEEQSGEIQDRHEMPLWCPLEDADKEDNKKNSQS